MIDLIPSLLVLIVVGVFVSRLKGQPIVQVFLCIVSGYVVAFPALDFSLSPDAPETTFAYHQIILAFFFVFPLLFFIAHRSKLYSAAPAIPSERAVLNIFAPAFLIGCVTAFVTIAYLYDLYLVRLSYTAYTLTTDAPTLFLAIYRMVLESSFFVILYLIYCVRTASPMDQHRSLYIAALILYILVFGSFFLINSRMQFLTLVILLGLSFYRPGTFSNRQIGVMIAAIIPLAILLTILRELVIEQTYRVDASSMANLLRETTLLISGRLNSTIMLDRAGELGYGFNPFSIDLSGLWYFIEFNISFFINSESYADMRASELTSPSVYVINSIMLSNFVDFPKSMVVDTLLIFGAYGLPFLAYFLAVVAVGIQNQMKLEDITKVNFILSIYILPLLFQFEKEFLGFITVVLKWSPMLIALLIVKPRAYRGQRAVAKELPGV